MKHLVVAVLSLFLTLAATAQTTHVKIKQSGAFASINESTDPLTTFSLTVSMNSSNTTGTNTSIFYQAVSVAADFNSESFTTISGSIPDSAFTGQGNSSLALNLDTSTLDPTLVIMVTCTLDFTTFIETCGPAPSGLIQLQFQENDAQRTQVLNFDEVITAGSMTTRIHQQSDNGTANVTGTIFGLQISSANGTVGTNKNSSLESIKTQ